MVNYVPELSFFGYPVFLQLKSLWANTEHKTGYVSGHFHTDIKCVNKHAQQLIKRRDQTSYLISLLNLPFKWPFQFSLFLAHPSDKVSHISLIDHAPGRLKSIINFPLKVYLASCLQPCSATWVLCNYLHFFYSHNDASAPLLLYPPWCGKQNLWLLWTFLVLMQTIIALIDQWQRSTKAVHQSNMCHCERLFFYSRDVQSCHGWLGNSQIWSPRLKVARLDTLVLLRLSVQVAIHGR